MLMFTISIKRPALLPQEKTHTLKKNRRGRCYLLYNLTEDVSHCKKEWLHSPVSFHPSPRGALLLSHMGQNSHPTGYATLLKYLETPTGLVGKATRRRRQTEGSVRGRCRGGSVNLRYGETEQPVK